VAMAVRHPIQEVTMVPRFKSRRRYLHGSTRGINRFDWTAPAIERQRSVMDDATRRRRLRSHAQQSRQVPLK
jgi:hypothetical protein